MDDKDWLILVTLYKEKSLILTSKILYVSQPAISYRIKNIEKDFNIKVYNKTKNGITFTPEGKLLIDYAEEMLYTLQRKRDELKELNKNESNILRLGVSSNFAYYVLPNLLRKFSNIQPDIQYKVQSGWSPTVYNYLKVSKVHVAIVRNNFKAHKTLLGEDSFYIISKKKIDMEDLPHLPMITYNTDNELKESIDKWWAENFSNTPAYIGMMVDRLETCKQMDYNNLVYSIVADICLNDADYDYLLTKKIYYNDHS